MHLIQHLADFARIHNIDVNKAFVNFNGYISISEREELAKEHGVTADDIGMNCITVTIQHDKQASEKYRALKKAVGGKLEAEDGGSTLVSPFVNIAQNEEAPIYTRFKYEGGYECKTSRECTWIGFDE
jgi:hypothetical protein